MSFRDQPSLVRDACGKAPPQFVWFILLLPWLAAVSLAGATARTPAKIDLNAFDALKKSFALPNAETLAYVPLGDPQGPAVVLIHGYTDNARDWVPLVPYLSPHFRLILVDIRGHGRSSKPDCCYTRFDFAYDIKLLLDVLGVAQADVVGHSLGSVIAQTFAENWPERTRRVVRNLEQDVALSLVQIDWKEPVQPLHVGGARGDAGGGSGGNLRARVRVRVRGGEK